MAETLQSSTPRTVVEHLVREQVYAKLGLKLPAASKAPNALLVNISARHCHLTSIRKASMPPRSPSPSSVRAAA
ncbi:MAG: hypothetical protein MUC40_05635 [Akkermansiaceae bacterium]|nr:hypothetical protein [Akkermansiaceae bacterium]